MSATLARKNIGFKAFGNPTEVPNNPIAKLMYYLDCVSAVIDYHDRTLTDYENYDNLSGEELVAIYQLAIVLKPELFIEAGIFIVNQNLLFDHDNQFYEITDETIGVHVNNEIMVGGKTVKVLKVMACNRRWLSSFYYNPMNMINSLIEDKQKSNNDRITTQTSIKKPVGETIESTKYQGEPITIVCRFCGKVITTKTQSKFNFVACFCFLIFNILYCCIQLSNDKNVLCCDVTHRCPECGSILGRYKSC